MATEKVTYELSLRDLMTKGLGDINSKLGKLEGELGKVEKTGTKTSNSLGSAFKTLGAAIVGMQLFSLGKDIIQTTAKFQSLHNAIKFASDGAIQGGASIIWLSRMSKEMGLDITATSEGFKTFQGAMINTKFSSGEVRTMFKQVSTGVTAMGLSADDAKGTFLALGQIMGKGKVQAEELRGQIGERVPGAFSLAARAMGVTTAQLDKLMKDGKLLSEDFLPKFAAEMERTFGVGAVLQADSLTSSINRMSNGWTELMVAMGNSQDGLGGVFNWIGKQLDSFADRFRTVEEIAKRLSNEKLVKYLDSVDKSSKTKKESLQKSGLSGTALADALQKEGGDLQGALKQQLARESAKLNDFTSKILTAEGVTGTFSATEADKKMSELMLTKKQSAIFDFGNVGENTYNEWEKKRAEVQFLKDASMGAQQVYDKTADASMLPANAGVTGKLKDQLSSVSGGVPKNVYINIDALIKGDINNVVSNVNNPIADLRTFMDQLEQALLTVVNDVSIVSDYGR